MDRWSSEFKTRLGNTPLANLRHEFNVHLALLRNSESRDRLSGPMASPTQTPYLVWLGMPGALLTLLLQRAIAGLEAWVVGAVWTELALADRLRKDTSNALENIGSLKGRGMAEKYYCSLPAMVSQELSLDTANPVLFRRNKVFYRDIRNPVMHGFEIDGKCVDRLHNCFEHVNDMYLWIDSWHDAQSAWQAFRGDMPVQGKDDSVEPVA